MQNFCDRNTQQREPKQATEKTWCLAQGLLESKLRPSLIAPSLIRLVEASSGKNVNYVDHSCFVIVGSKDGDPSRTEKQSYNSKKRYFLDIILFIFCDYIIYFFWLYILYIIKGSQGLPVSR